MEEALRPNDEILLNLVNPKEKFWGALLSLTPVGITFQGINLDSFDDFVRQAAKRNQDEHQVNLVTMFVPLFRVERIFADEASGSLQSFGSRFEAIVGMPVVEYVELMRKGESKS